jgi:hypothetical protein
MSAGEPSAPPRIDASPRIGDWTPHPERWLLEEGIAKANGEPGRYALTEHRAKLVALIATCGD